MGDAAHVHSPAGGQGMNTGLVDAIVLGDLLAEVLLRWNDLTDRQKKDILKQVEGAASSQRPRK